MCLSTTLSRELLITLLKGLSQVKYSGNTGWKCTHYLLYLTATNPALTSSSVTVLPPEHTCMYFLFFYYYYYFFVFSWSWCLDTFLLLSSGLSRRLGLPHSPRTPPDSSSNCQVDGTCYSAAPRRPWPSETGFVLLVMKWTSWREASKLLMDLWEKCSSLWTIASNR